MPKAKDCYKIEGRGDSPKSADREADDAQKGLAKKLADAKVNSDVSAARSLFIADYTLRQGMDPTKVDATRFSIQSAKSWDDVAAKAARLSDGGKYDSTFVVERYFEFTEEQMAATRGTKQTSACYRDARASSLRLPPRL